MKLARPMASAASANAAAAAVTVAGAAGLGRRRHLICLAGNYGAAKYSLTHNRVNNQRVSIHRIEIFIQSADWRGGAIPAPPQGQQSEPINQQLGWWRGRGKGRVEGAAQAS